MRKVIKTTLDQLHALGCQLDHADRELRTDRWRFTHPNAPGEVFTVNYQSSEIGLRTIVQRAKVAAGLATSDTLEKRAPRRNHREKMDRAAEQRKRVAAREVAAARRAREVAERDAEKVAAHRRSLDGLMRGRDVGDAPVPNGFMLTVAEVADSTGVTDKAVRRAIDAQKLEAYMCGGVVKVKGADVRAWLNGGAA